MIIKCRVCDSQNIKSILSLGFTPLANALLTVDQLDKPEEKYPLDLVFCENCTLVQIVETVPPEKLFSQYFYNSSISQTTIENAKQNTDNLINRLKLNELSAIIEIGSNDGYLLQNYVDHNIPVWGIEPAKNIAKVANEKGIRTWCGFFTNEQAKRFVGNTDSTKGWHILADVVHANNVLAHVADLHSVIAGIKTLLKPNGVAVVETHYVRDLFDHVEFDCVYHEHLCYYSLHALEYLFGMHGMTLVDVERLPIHGGSLRAYFQPEDGPKTLMEKGKPRIDKVFREEELFGLISSDYYQSLGDKVLSLKKRLTDLLKQLKKEDKTIAIYGASAKSTTLLNYFGIDGNMIEYVVDDTPDKQGKFTPGTHIPIYSSSKLLQTQPDYVLILTWNFASEIISKQSAYQKRGGHFIIPIPEVKII